MSNKLTWLKSNPDAVFTGYDIYRSTSKDTIFDEGSLIVTISDLSVTEYEDVPPDLTGKYYYGIITKTVDGPLKSNILPSYSTSTPGIGSNTIIVGDSNNGLLDVIYDTGMLRKADAYIFDRLFAAFGSSAFITLPTLTDKMCVYKVIEDGRITFVPCVFTLSSGNLTLPANRLYNELLADMIENPPVIESEGISYQLDIMTRDEVSKYLLSGVTTMLTHWSTVLPRINVTTAMNLVYQPGTDTTFASTITGAGVESGTVKTTGTTSIATHSITYVLRPI